MKEQLEKVTSDSTMMLRNKVEELTALETAVEERNSELVA